MARERDNLGAVVFLRHHDSIRRGLFHVKAPEDRDSGCRWHEVVGVFAVEEAAYLERCI